MKVKAPTIAPDWAHDFAQNTQDVIDNAIWPYISRTPIQIAQLPQAGVLNMWKKYYVSDGLRSMREVTSNGTDWRYPDGTSA